MAKKKSNAELVRTVLADLSSEASNKDIAAAVKDRFGTTINPNYVSTVRNADKKVAKNKGTNGQTNGTPAETVATANGKTRMSSPMSVIGDAFSNPLSLENRIEDMAARHGLDAIRKACDRVESKARHILG